MKQLKNKEQKDKKQDKNKFFIAGGVLVLIISFLVLSKTDPRGENFASHIVPFLFISSWGLIIYGILRGDR
ncbi:MAG: hypothetical protein ABIJ15_07465 [bacterium]